MEGTDINGLDGVQSRGPPAWSRGAREVRDLKHWRRKKRPQPSGRLMATGDNRWRRRASKGAPHP